MAQKVKIPPSHRTLKSGRRVPVSKYERDKRPKSKSKVRKDEVIVSHPIRDMSGRIQGLSAIQLDTRREEMVRDIVNRRS